MQVEARNHGKQCAASGTPNDSPSVCPTARAATPNPRGDRASTMKYPQGACFATSPEVGMTCVAREVTLYLAVPSPSSSRLALPSLIASSSSVRGRARFGAATATLEGPAPGPENRSIIGLAEDHRSNTWVLAAGPPWHRRRASRQPRRRPAASRARRPIRSRFARSNRARAGPAPELGRTSHEVQSRGLAPLVWTQAKAERRLAARLSSLRWPRGHRLLPRGPAFCGDLPRGRASCLSRPVPRIAQPHRVLASSLRDSARPSATSS